MKKVLCFSVFLLASVFAFWLAFGPIGKTIAENTGDGVERSLTWLFNQIGITNNNFWLFGLLTRGFLPVLTVIVGFLPQLLILYFFIELVRQTNAISLLSKKGSASELLAVVLGFGCTTMAVMSFEQTISNPATRRRLSFVLPFLTCGSKMPAITLLLTATLNLNFMAVYTLYFAPAAVGVAVFLFLKRKDNNTSRNSPSGRRDSSHEAADGVVKKLLAPNFLRITKQTLTNIWLFIKRISFSVTVAIMALYFLSNHTFFLHVTTIENSALMSICNIIAPFFTPLGFGSAALVACLLFGIAGKEMIAVAITMLGGVALLDTFSTATILSFTIFILLYPPCFPAMTAITRQTNRRTARSVALFTLMTAYACAFVFYMTCTIMLAL
jgi:ferrous iron transport protein B